MHLAETRNPAPPPALLARIPPGESGVRETLRIMSALVRRWKKDPAIHEFAEDLVRDLPQKHFVAEVAALHRFVRDKIRYLKDVTGVETVRTPPLILRRRQGDCDDKSLLLATLLETIGHPTRFVAVGFSPYRYSHVFVESLVGRNWVPLETTEPRPMGWGPPGVVKRMVVSNSQRL